MIFSLQIGILQEATAHTEYSLEVATWTVEATEAPLCSTQNLISNSINTLANVVPIHAIHMTKYCIISPHPWVEGYSTLLVHVIYRMLVYIRYL